METRENGIVKVSIKGIITNIILVIFKAIVGLIAGSISIILDAVNNLTDALSSGITIIGVKLSNKPATKKHPYGYGRIEYLTSIVIAIIIIVAAVTALYESILKIINPTTPVYEVYSFIIIGVAILVKVLLGLYYRKKGKELNSESLKASGMDALLDSILSLATLIGMIVNVAFGLMIEGYLGIVIGLFILKAGIDIIRDTLSLIIGERIDSDLVVGLKRLATSFDEVYGCYDVIIHNYGPEKLIGTIHVELNDNLQAKEIHDLSEKIITKAYEEYGIALTVGIYARNDSSEFSSKVRDDILKILEDYKTLKQFHGYYINLENKTILFDIIFDFKEHKQKELVEEIRNRVHDLYPEYNVIVNLDTDYSD